MFISYQNGERFAKDNSHILRQFPLETIFFAENAARMNDLSDGFIVKVSDGAESLLCLKYRHFPMSIFGCERLCSELAGGLVSRGLNFDRVLASNSIVTRFFAEYEAIAGGSHTVNRELELMQCCQPSQTDTTGAEQATPEDADEISQLASRFTAELALDNSRYSELVRHDIANFALLRSEGRIATIARRARETDYLCSVTGVYTAEEFRGRGYARKVVAYLTNRILAQEKRPYLFVDKANSEANRLYLHLGYEYVAPQLEVSYRR